MPIFDREKARKRLESIQSAEKKRSIRNKDKKDRRWVDKVLDKLTVLKLIIVKTIRAKRLTVTDTLTAKILTITDTLKAKTGIFGDTEKMTLTDNAINVKPGDLTLDVSGDIIADVAGGQFTIKDTTMGDPDLIIESNSNDALSGTLTFNKVGRTGAVDDYVGMVVFNGKDASDNIQNYAYIHGRVDVPTHGQEGGRLELGVASHDGGGEAGLTLTGGSVNTEVDVIIGKGASSITAVAGNITVVGTVDGVDIAVRDALHNFTYHYVVANFYSTSTSTAFFVPLVGGTSEIATPGSSSGERFGMIAPHNGTLEKVMIRSENLMRFDFLCELVTASDDTEIPATVVGTLNGDFSGSNVADDNTYTYDFTGALTSGVNTFSKGQVLAIRIDPTSQYLGDTYCMCVFKYDITT